MNIDKIMFEMYIDQILLEDECFIEEMLSETSVSNDNFKAKDFMRNIKPESIKKAMKHEDDVMTKAEEKLKEIKKQIKSNQVKDKKSALKMYDKYSSISDMAYKNLQRIRNCLKNGISSEADKKFIMGKVSKYE